MFTSATNNNISTNTLNTTMSPFPQYYFQSSSSSSHSSSLPNYLTPQPHLLSPQPIPSTLPLGQDDIFSFHNQNHHYDPTTFFLPQTMQSFGDCNNNGENSKRDLSLPEKMKKPAAKKDRHSKIFTAQGLRDRRVRLSIEIAREFFDLHDILGFDKASKTLEWLLRQSKDAIREISMTSLRGPRSHSDLDHQVVDQETLDGQSQSQGKVVVEEASIASLVAKQSRAKARARARARSVRTKENVSVKKISSQLNRSTAQIRQSGFDPCPSLDLDVKRHRSGQLSNSNDDNKHFNIPWSSNNGNYDHLQAMSLREVSKSSSVVVYSSSDNWDINSMATKP